MAIDEFRRQRSRETRSFFPRNIFFPIRTTSLSPTLLDSVRSNYDVNVTMYDISIQFIIKIEFLEDWFSHVHILFKRSKSNNNCKIDQDIITIIVNDRILSAEQIYDSRDCRFSPQVRYKYFSRA